MKRIRPLRKDMPPLTLRSLLAQLRQIPPALTLVWNAAPAWTSITLGLLLVQGLLPVVTVYLTRTLVNALAALVHAGAVGDALSAAATTAGLMGAVLLTSEILSSAAGYVRTALAEQVQDHLHGLIHAKAVALDLSFYESATYYDQLHRASIEALDRPLALLESLGTLAQHAITLVAMGGVLLGFAWWMPLVLLAGTLPALGAALHATWQMQQWRLRNTLNQRRLTYLHRLLTFDEAAAELRLFALGEFFSQQYTALCRRLYGERLQLSRQQLALQIGAGVLGLLSLALALAWMGWRAFQGLFALGDLAMFYQAVSQGQRLMRSLLTGVGEIYRNLWFLDDLFAFLHLEPRLTEPPNPVHLESPLSRGIEIAHVTFAYPDSATAALRDFQLHIPAGQIVAIVGENGAGKSTLLKLLCRFYDPQQGRITWDGVDLRELSLADLRRRITVLFQEPVPYHDTVADNIRFGDLAAQPSLAQIEAAAAASGVTDIIARLPQGYATVLGKWFGYTELSVGEWQRLALARAFIRQADLVILDEPTSAMDSWAEMAWMARFRELVNGRTALIITHRFTTAMQADIIHVMADGRIIESGAHDALVALGGHYAASWRQQMREAQQSQGARVAMQTGPDII